jgi:hypothetical protein
MANRRFWIGTFAALLAMATPVAAQEQGAAGRVKIASGSAFIVRAGAEIPAVAGAVVYEADGLKTGADGRIGVTLKDNTRVSIGPTSEVSLDRYAYAPGEGQFAFAMKVVRGVAAYVSGQIAKLSPDAVRLETPTAIVGVRGTSLAMRVEP